jgi:hypothetical protein
MVTQTLVTLVRGAGDSLKGDSMDATRVYLTFLVLGVLLVLIDGQLIGRSGRGYLRKVYEPEAARSMIKMVVGFFYLVMLGLIALISLISVNTGLPVRDIVVKLGVLFLVLAAAHGFTMTILMRIRDRRWQEQISDEITESRYNPAAQGPSASVRPVVEAEELGRQTKSSELHW